MVIHFSRVGLFATPWTVARQAPLSTGLPRQDTGVACCALLQGIFRTQRSSLRLLSSALAGTFFLMGFPGGSDGKKSACNTGDLGSIPELGRSPREEWQPIPVFLTGESHGQKSLVGYSPWGCKELDMTE